MRFMKRSKETIDEQFKKMKKMWEEGCSIKEMALACGVGYCTVYNTFNLMGISLKKQNDESNLVYADNIVNLEKVVINGKRYTDMTPVFAPR